MQAVQAERKDEEIEWSDIFRLVWDSRWVVMGIALASIAGGATYLHLATKSYRAQVSVIPVEHQASSNVLSQLGSLASLAGIGLGGGGSGAEAIAILKSRDLMRDYIEQQGLLTVLFADKWDLDAGQWRVGVTKIPDVRDAVTLFERRVRSINEDKKSGLVTLSITWRDPVQAKEWSEGIIGLANERLQKRALDQAQKNILMLRETLKSTDIAAVQQAIGRLLEAELQKELLARGQKEFSFRVVDGPELPKNPVSPRPALVGIITFLVAGGLSLVYALTYGFLRTMKGSAVGSRSQ